jgi:hypothetical protein
MEITKKITVKLSPDDLREIITEHLKSKGVEVDGVDFRVKGYNMEGDWLSEYPLQYRLEEVMCSGVEKPK